MPISSCFLNKSPAANRTVSFAPCGHVFSLFFMSEQHSKKNSRVKNFLVWLKEHGLNGVKLVVGDKASGMVEAIGDVFPEARYQHCTVHINSPDSYQHLRNSLAVNRY